MRGRAVLAGACGAAGCVELTPTVPFAEVRTEILVPSCSSSSCHGAGAGDLWLTAEIAYDALVEVPSVGAPDAVLVVPGDADTSYLVQKLEGAPGIAGAAMPWPDGGLDPGDVVRVRAWIDQGAWP